MVIYLFINMASVFYTNFVWMKRNNFKKKKFPLNELNFLSIKRPTKKGTRTEQGRNKGRSKKRKVKETYHDIHNIVPTICIRLDHLLFWHNVLNYQFVRLQITFLVHHDDVFLTIHNVGSHFSHPKNNSNNIIKFSTRSAHTKNNI